MSRKGVTESAEILLEMYKMQVGRSEHYESLRSSVVNYLIVVSMVLVSVAAADSRITPADSWIGATLTVLGVFGFGAVTAHARRSTRHGLRAAAYRNALDETVPDARINKIRKTISRTSTRLNFLWTIFPVMISFIGLAILSIANMK
jgi:hypothetical protein